MLPDRCDLCGGNLEAGKTTLELWIGAQLIVIKDVPAGVGQQCHEAYLSPAVSEKLDEFVSNYPQLKAEKYLSVPEFSASQALR